MSLGPMQLLIIAILILVIRLIDLDPLEAPFQGGIFLTFAANCCDATINGVEGDLTVQPIPGLTFNAAAAYNRSKLTRAAVGGHCCGAGGLHPRLPGVAHAR